MNTLFTAGRRAGTNALQVARADAASWGSHLETATRTVAAVVVACFAAGETLGRFVHQLNADLARAYRCLLVGGHRAVEAIEPAAAAAIELIETATGLPLSSHSVVELRTLARQRGIKQLNGTRIAQCRRADLLAALA